MPPRNAIKQYLSNGYYHIYNRGVEKRVIFQDEQDYSVLLSYLKEYLLPKNTQELTKRLADPNISYRERAEIIKMLRLNNFAGEINLLAYCLMPNHFHFLVKQKNIGSIDKFINSLGTRYTMYFNRRYKRVGPLYQGVYKAVLVDTDDQLLQLSRYIHIQALQALGLKGLKGDAFRAFFRAFRADAFRALTVDWCRGFLRFPIANQLKKAHVPSIPGTSHIL